MSFVVEPNGVTDLFEYFQLRKEYLKGTVAWDGFLA